MILTDKPVLLDKGETEGISEHEMHGSKLHPEA
jgi:hypothetical protein